MQCAFQIRTAFSGWVCKSRDINQTDQDYPWLKTMENMAIDDLVILNTVLHHDGLPLFFLFSSPSFFWDKGRGDQRRRINHATEAI
jgi:hypothetical protein